MTCTHKNLSAIINTRLILSLYILTIFILPVAVAVNPANAAISNIHGSSGDSIDTATFLSCEGAVSHVNTVEWEESSTSLHDPPLDAGGIFMVWFDEEGNPIYGWTADPDLAEFLGEPVPPGEIRSTAGYSVILQTGQGVTSLVRDIRVSSHDTQRSEVAAVTHVAFHSGNDRDVAIFTEDIALDAAAAHTTEYGTSSSHPLADTPPFNPPFCEFVEMGSKALIVQGTIATDASAKFPGHSSLPTTSMDYSITSGSQVGSAEVPGTVGILEAFIRSRAERGDMVRVFLSEFDEFPHLSAFLPVEPSRIEYAEHTTANGIIKTFSKEMHFKSRNRRL